MIVFNVETHGGIRFSSELTHGGGPRGTSLMSGGWSGAEAADQLAGSVAAPSTGHEKDVPAGAARHRALPTSESARSENSRTRCSAQGEVASGRCQQ